jgi:hypothetical protein
VAFVSNSSRAASFQWRLIRPVLCGPVGAGRRSVTDCARSANGTSEQHSRAELHRINLATIFRDCDAIAIVNSRSNEVLAGLLQQGYQTSARELNVRLTAVFTGPPYILGFPKNLESAAPVQLLLGDFGWSCFWPLP